MHSAQRQRQTGHEGADLWSEVGCEAAVPLALGLLGAVVHATGGSRSRGGERLPGLGCASPARRGWEQHRNREGELRKEGVLEVGRRVS